MNNPGRIFLIPNLLHPLAPVESALPANALHIVKELRYFFVENEKSAWRLLSKIIEKSIIGEITLQKIPEYPNNEVEYTNLLSPILLGKDAGIISDAGLPCVADPGGYLVRIAHQYHITIHPLAGPSSIFLALAASGLYAQTFTFIGYLPPQSIARRKMLISLNKCLAKDGITRIIIETPHRRLQLFLDCLAVLDGVVQLCIAFSLSSPDESIITRSIKDWKMQNKNSLQNQAKAPAIFLIGRNAIT